MIPKVATQEVEVFGANDDDEDMVDFSIMETPEAYQILSSGLYKDKITAILREIAANAYDAHIDAGIADRPILIHLPTTLDSELRIRDFGKGMTHELMRTVFRTYFGSLKKLTNDQVGGLGLGCKAPFSKVDQYVVISRNEGERRIYDLFKHKGRPRLMLRSREPLADGEETGLEVIVKVATAVEAREYVTKAVNVFELYPVLPEFTGATFPGIQRLPVRMEGNGWRIRDNKTYGVSPPRAIMGVIAYPINADDVFDESDATKLTQMARGVLKANLEVDFEIGDLEFTAGREELSYSDETRKMLARRLVTIAKELNRRIKKQFDDCETLRDAHILHGKLFASGSGLARIFDTSFEVDYRGRKISSSNMTVNMNAFRHSRIVHYLTPQRSRRSRRNPDKLSEAALRYSVTFAPNDDPLKALFEVSAEDDTTQFFIDDLNGAGFHAARIRRHREIYKNKVVLIQADKRELAVILDALEGFEINPVSSLPMPEREKRVVEKASVKRLSSYSQASGQVDDPRDSYHWHSVDIDPTEGGIYVLMCRGLITRDGSGDDHSASVMATWLRSAMNIGIIDQSTPIYALPLSQAKRFTATKKNADKWVSFFDIVESGVKQRANKVELKRISEYAAQRSFARPFQYFSDLAAEISKIMPKHAIADIARATEVEAARAVVNQSMFVMLPEVGVRIPEHDRDFTKEAADAVARYPLLRHMMRGHLENNELKLVAEYVSMLDDKNGSK